MTSATNLDDELGGLDIGELPPELQEVQEEAKQEKKSQGGYRFDSAADRAHIKAQRGAIWGWLRGLGGNLIKHGVNLTKVALPVELCEPRSFLERLTDSWAYLDLLHAAAAATDPVERLKLVVGFAVGGMRQQVSCDKPFNPILGETLQGTYSCGCSVCAEQISHHPPISCWQVKDHAGRFEFTGSSCWSAIIMGNSVKGSQSGESRVWFASDGATVTWSLPSIHIRGVLFGERVVKYQDTLVFRDVQNGLECVLQIEPNAPKRGLVKRVLHKARHPRSKGGGTHDQLLGELVRLPASAAGNNSNSKGSSSSKKGGGSAVLLDTCDGTWLTDLTWDKGVRSTAVPDSYDPAAAAAAAAKSAAAAVAAAAASADEDAASVVCHSIGSFSSSTSGSTVGDDGGKGGEVAAAGGNGVGAMNGAAAADSSDNSSHQKQHHHKHHSRSSSGGLTAAALAAHTSASGAAAAAGAGAGAPKPPQQQQQQQQLPPPHPSPPPAAAGGTTTGLSSAVSGANRSSSAALSSSDAAGHRSGRGISVVKQLWAPGISTVYKLHRLPNDDPQLLPSDSRYRPDVMALAGGANQAAQHWKLVLEQRQRADRNLRGHAATSSLALSGGGGHGHGHSSSSGGGAGGGGGQQQQQQQHQHHRHSSSRGSDHFAGDGSDQQHHQQIIRA